jgi:hypothetical protein
MAAQAKINPTDPQPTCNMGPATYIPADELQAYTKKAMEEKLVDQQVRSIDIGKSRIGIGIEYRTKLDKPGANSVAEHDQISEVYRIIDGSATLVLGPDIVNRQRRPATQRTVVEYNGPGNNGESINNPMPSSSRPATWSSSLRAPGPLVHQDRHISYFMVHRSRQDGAIQWR